MNNPQRGLGLSPSLILSKLTYNYYSHKNEGKQVLLFAAKKKKPFQKKKAK